MRPAASMRQMAMMYAAFKDPKGAGVVFLVLGLFLCGVGVWFAFALGGIVPWVAIGGGALLAVTGWPFRSGIE